MAKLLHKDCRKQHFSAYFSKSTIAWIKRYAEVQQTTMTAIAEQAVKEYREKKIREQTIENLLQRIEELEQIVIGDDK